jgi:O-antigen/teichoic acid export membrane protein
MLKQISGFALGPIVSALIGLITVPILTRLIMPEIYAQISLVQITLQLLSIAVLVGLDQGYVREYYEVENKQTLLAYTLGLNMVVAVLICLGFFLFYVPVSQFLFDTSDYYSVCIIALTVFPMLLLRYVALSLRMETRAFAYSLLLIVQSGANLIIVLLLLHYNVFSQLHAVLIANASALLLALIVGVFCINIFSNMSRFEQLDRALLQKLLVFSAPLMVSTLFMWILYSADQYMLRALSSFEQLGLYAASYKLCAALMLMQVIASTVWVPICLRWVKEDKSINSFRQVGVLVTCALVLIFLSLLILKDYIVILLGSEYRGAVVIFPYLLMFPIYYTAAEITSVGIMISKRTKILMPITFCSAVLNITLNYYLIPLWGAKGAAIATAVTFAIYFHLRLYYSNKYWRPISVSIYYFMSFICGLLLVLLEFYEMKYALIVLFLLLSVYFVRKVFAFIEYEHHYKINS